jgi:hypothetical protein
VICHHADVSGRRIVRNLSRPTRPRSWPGLGARPTIPRTGHQREGPGVSTLRAPGRREWARSTRALPHESLAVAEFPAVAP